MLPLSKIEQWHHSRFLVLAGIPAKHLLDELLVDRIEFEGNIGVVIGSVAVLNSLSTL